MRTSLLRWRINCLYERALKRLPTLVDGKLAGAFSSKRERAVGERNRTTYEGYMLCGAMSHILYDMQCQPSKKYICSRGRGHSYEDHMFLRMGDIIIDPTYRQMFRSYHGKGNEKFFRLLYEEQPPFFVGRMNEVSALYADLNAQHIMDFGEELESNIDFYINAQEHPSKNGKNNTNKFIHNIK